MLKLAVVILAFVALACNAGYTTYSIYPPTDSECSTAAVLQFIVSWFWGTKLETRIQAVANPDALLTTSCNCRPTILMHANPWNAPFKRNAWARSMFFTQLSSTAQLRVSRRSLPGGNERSLRPMLLATSQDQHGRLFKVMLHSRDNLKLSAGR